MFLRAPVYRNSRILSINTSASEKKREIAIKISKNLKYQATPEHPIEMKF